MIRLRRHPFVPLAAALTLATLPTACAPAPSALPPPPLRQQDVRLAAVVDRLALAATPRCAERAGRTGLVLHALDQYAPASRPAVAAEFALGATAGVMAVVPGSPAAVAGVRPDDRLLAADGAAVARVTAGPATYATVAGTLDALDAATSDGAMTLRLERAGAAVTLALTTPPACRVRAVLTGDTRAQASTDGLYLKLSAGLLAELPATAEGDAELAAVVAHELAHVILGHPDAIRAGTARTRDTEAAADTLSIALMADSGVDPAAAPRFWRRFGPAHAPLFGDASHGGWRERAARLDAAIARLPPPGALPN